MKECNRWGFFNIRRVSVQHPNYTERLKNSKRYIGSNKFAIFFCMHCSSWWTLASFMSACHWSWSCDFCLQFLTPIVSTSSSTESSKLIAYLPTHRVPAGLCRVSFLQGFCSCILGRCSSHINHPNLINLTIYS
jgi:hypothetical protein